MAKEYFPFTGKIPFEGKDSKNVMAFHYYEPERTTHLRAESHADILGLGHSRASSPTHSLSRPSFLHIYYITASNPRSSSLRFY